MRLNYDAVSPFTGRKSVLVEYDEQSGQNVHLCMETGYQMNHFINKYDGEPFTLEWLLKEVEACMSGKPVAKKRELAGVR
jgi:hypothetical protein